MSTFEETFRARYREVYGIAWRILGDRAEAEDAAQEAFAKLARSPLLQRPDDEVAAWLRRVTINDCFNRTRGRRRARTHADRAGRLEPVGGVDSTGPLVAVLRSEEQAEVRAALADLPERQRTALLLRHSGYRYREIAQTLGIAVGSVGVLLARAERAFRTAYEETTP